METSGGHNAAMLSILYSTAVTALDKLRGDGRVSAGLIADLEAVVDGSRAELERIAGPEDVTSAAEPPRYA